MDSWQTKWKTSQSSIYCTHCFWLNSYCKLPMSNDIQNIQLRFSCPESWDNMTPNSNGRYCDKCNKTVHDFTNSKVEEFRAIVAENNNGFCGRFRIDQMAAVPVALPLWKRWLSAALVLIGINLFACKSNTKHLQAIPSCFHLQVKTHLKLISSYAPILIRLQKKSKTKPQPVQPNYHLHG